jgi:hypothetical protein
MEVRDPTGKDAPPPSLGICGRREAMLFSVVQCLQMAYRELHVFTKKFLLLERVSSVLYSLDLLCVYRIYKVSDCTGMQ